MRYCRDKIARHKIRYIFDLALWLISNKLLQFIFLFPFQTAMSTVQLSSSYLHFCPIFDHTHRKKYFNLLDYIESCLRILGREMINSLCTVVGRRWSERHLSIISLILGVTFLFWQVWSNHKSQYYVQTSCENN